MRRTIEATVTDVARADRDSITRTGQGRPVVSRVTVTAEGPDEQKASWVCDRDAAPRVGTVVTVIIDWKAPAEEESVRA